MFMGSKDHDLKIARAFACMTEFCTLLFTKKKIVKLLVVIFVHFEERFFFHLPRYDLRLLIPETRDKMLLVIKDV